MNFSKLPLGDLKKLTEIPAVSSYEKQMGAYIQQLIETKTRTTIESLASGSILIGKQDANILISAHMDEVGCIISDIKDNGVLKIQSAGWLKPKIVAGQHLIIHGTIDNKPVEYSGIAVYNEPLDIDCIKSWTDLDVVLGFKNKEEVIKAGIKPGLSFASYPRHWTHQKNTSSDTDYIIASALDNRIGVFMLWLLYTVFQKEINNGQLGLAFTTCEEADYSGTKKIAAYTSPDLVIVVDIIPNNFLLGNDIKFDGPPVIPYKMGNHLISEACRDLIADVPHQVYIAEPKKHFELESEVYHSSIANALAISFLVPTHNYHHAVSGVYTKAITQAMSSLYKLIEKVIKQL